MYFFVKRNLNIVQFASITKRVAKLGSEKWMPHLKAKKMAEFDPDVILLTIGQPDISVSDELANITIKAIKEGRTGYSNGRGEPNLVSSLVNKYNDCLLYTSPSPRDLSTSRMPSSA